MLPNSCICNDADGSQLWSGGAPATAATAHTLQLRICSTRNFGQCTQNSARCTLYPAKCTLDAAKCTLYPANCTLSPAKCILEQSVSILVLFFCVKYAVGVILFCNYVQGAPQKCSNVQLTSLRFYDILDSLCLSFTCPFITGAKL